MDKTLHIKGQMLFIQEWNQILFLACPIMNDLNHLIWTGLFVNDLSMHDYSRDIMLATAQVTRSHFSLLLTHHLKRNTCILFCIYRITLFHITYNRNIQTIFLNIVHT